MTSYRNTIDKEYPSLIDRTSYNCSKNYALKDKISIVNGLQIKECLNLNLKSIIYIWKPNCSSKICIDIELVQNICLKNNINLFVIAEYYDLEKMKKSYTLERPIFGIDTHFYKTNLTKKNLNKFLIDLIGDYVNKEKTSMFYIFHGSKLLKNSNNLDELII